MRDTRPVLLFDFDGTLVDSMMTSLDILYRLVHHAPLPVEDISEIRGMTLLEVLHRLRISPWRALLLRASTYQMMAERMEEVAFVSGVEPMLHELAQHYKLYIVSSNSADNIRMALNRFGLSQIIAGIQGSANPLSKVGALRRLSRAERVRPQDTWYVGDQAGDIYAAHRSGMKAAAVSWGFSNLHALEAAHPDLLVFTPEELLQHFNGGSYGA